MSVPLSFIYVISQQKDCDDTEVWVQVVLFDWRFHHHSIAVIFNGM